MDNELHYPPGAEPAPSADEPASPAAPEGEQPTPNGTVEQPKPGDEPAAPAPKPGEPKPDDPPTPPLPKPRSIYDDLKDTRKDRNAWRDTATAALKAQGIELKGNETPDELQALIQQNPPAPAPTPVAPATPSNPETPADDLEAYAQEHQLDASALGRLAEIIGKRIPVTQLSEEDKQGLADLKTWRQQQQQATEDAEIFASAPTVKTQLSITDEAELQTVMKEVLRLAHTPEFHDKEVEYIVWKNKDTLSKLVSPSKPSFEQGGQRGDAAAEAEPDFSTGKVTPEQAQKHMYRPKSAFEVRPAK